MTVETRKSKINEAKVFPLNFGEWTHYEVQGSEGRYHVYISPVPRKKKIEGLAYYKYRPTCHSKADPKAFPVCKGNSDGTVCYHCLAAIRHRAARHDKVLSLPENGEFGSAVKLLNFGGQLVKITNQNNKSVWGTAR